MGKKKNFALEETTSQGPAGVPLSASNESNDGDQPSRGEAATEATASSTSNQHNQHNHHHEQQQQQQQHNHQNNSLNNNNTPTSPGPPSAIVIEDDSNFHIPPMMSTSSGPPPLPILEQNKHNIDDNINDHDEQQQQQQQQHEEEEHMSLLELGEETMAQAMLIFLLADLRILSATGRIRTLFEHLALDSDRSPRLTSRDYAGFYDYEDTEGVTASHIMAILLVEILREAEDVAKDRNKKPRHPHHHRRRYKPALLSPWASATDASNHHHHHHAGVNARKIFKRDIRAANGMPSLLHCYNEMLSEDVNPKIARVSRRMYPLDEDIILMMKGHAGGGGVGVGGGYNNNSTNWIETMESGEEVATGGGGTPEFFPEDEVSLGGASWNNTSNSTPQQQQQQQQQQYPSSFTTPGGPTFIPPIPKPQSLMNIERSASLSFSQYTQHSHKSGGGASVGGGGGGGLATPATPATPPTVSASRTMQRRASTNLEPSHFNPNVDMEDEKDDDSVQLVDQLFAPGGSKKSQLQSQSSQLQEQKEDQAAAAAASLNHHQQTPSSPVNKKNMDREDSTESTIGGGGGGGGGAGTPTHHNSTQPTPSAVAVSSSALAMMHASMPSLNYTFKEIRERVEKAIPEQLSIRVEQLTKNFPKGPVARQQQELDEIAQMQNQLLKWGEDSEELVATTTNTTSGGAKASSGRETTSAASTARRKELRKELAQLREKFRSHHEQEHDDGGDDAGGGGGGGAGDGNSSIAEEEEGVEVSTPLSDDGDDGDVSLQIPEYHDSDTIRQLILQALDKRDFWRLGFIKTFFREGTVSHILANSRAEMVWLSDWHTQHECTYAISIDREKQKVLLAFRGAYTETDWRHIVDWYDTATSNPVKEDYPNRPNNIRLHSGFHKYLFRVRKDTGTTKYDEITAKLRHYCKLTGPSTRITITGHSLGAALAAIFSLYASTEDRFTDHCGAIECVTFGAPCIGNWRFAGAVKHQENVGKLRIAKFHVKGDSVPHLPPALIRYSSRGAQYWHSGIDVSLPYIRPNNFFQKFLGGQPKPKITYWDPDKESYLGSLCRQFREYYVWNLPIRFWRFALFHTLVEHKKRMALVSKSDPNSLLTKYSLKELYEMREDLTRRPFWKRSEEGRKKS